MESFDLEVTGNFDAALQTDILPPLEFGAQHAEETQVLTHFAAQPIEDEPNQTNMETNPTTQAWKTFNFIFFLIFVSIYFEFSYYHRDLVTKH